MLSRHEARICPVCRNPTRKLSREHLPFKALYRSAEDPKPAIIRTCECCNGDKSVYDHEILALYGHHISARPAAECAQRSLPKLTSISDLGKLVLATARFCTAEGKKIATAGGVNADVVSLWLEPVGRGTYFFFTREVFEGIVDPCNHLDKLNSDRRDFDWSSADYHHKINNLCTLSMSRKKSDTSWLVAVHLFPPAGLDHFAFCCFLHESEDQAKAFYSNRPESDFGKPQIVEPRREIYRIVDSETGGRALDGIDRVRKEDDE